MKRYLKSNQGFTLAEVLVTALVFLVGFVCALLLFINSMSSTEYAGDLTTATAHSEHIFEEMKTRATLANITATDWQGWAQSDGMITLPQETVTVTYVNQAANPLDITVTISWVRKSRSYNVSLRTQMTK